MCLGQYGEHTPIGSFTAVDPQETFNATAPEIVEDAQRKVEHIVGLEVALTATPRRWSLRSSPRQSTLELHPHYGCCAIREDEAPFAWRGKAVELAVAAIVFEGVSDDDATEIAMAAFESEGQREISSEITRQGNAISDMVRRAAWIFRKLGRQ